MFWKMLYWWVFAESGWWFSKSIIIDDISFDWYGLQNSNIIIESFNPLDSWSVEYLTFNIPQDNWKWFLNKFWREKIFVLKGIIKQDTQIKLEEKIDELKKNLRKNEGILVYKLWNWKYRQIKATLTNISFQKEHYNIVWIPFTLEFKANEPFWYDSIPKEVVFPSVSTSPFWEELLNDWNEESKPQITIYFISASNVTSISIETNNRNITLTWNITAGDIVIIDCLNRVVKKNNVIQDYSWTFLKLNPWLNTITYTINWTFVCDISNIFRSNYL